MNVSQGIKRAHEKKCRFVSISVSTIFKHLEHCLRPVALSEYVVNAWIDRGCANGWVKDGYRKEKEIQL